MEDHLTRNPAPNPPIRLVVSKTPPTGEGSLVTSQARAGATGWSRLACRPKPKQYHQDQHHRENPKTMKHATEISQPPTSPGSVPTDRPAPRKK